MRSVVVQIGIRVLFPVMAKICAVRDYVVKFEIQILIRLLSLKFTWFS